METMGRLEDPAALPFLAQALQDPNSDVRHDAINAIEDIEVPESLILLKQALNDPNPSVANNAKDAIEDLKKKLAEQGR